MYHLAKLYSYTPKSKKNIFDETIKDWVQLKIKALLSNA